MAARTEEKSANITTAAKLNTAPDSGRLTVQLNCMVSMRDGTRLCTDIYRPGIPAKGTLMLSTPYNSKTPWLMCLSRKMAKHGFVVVVQNSRERFGSEGKFRPFEDERSDGFDTLAWLSKQEWATRKVGLLGMCYSVYSSYPLMAVEPPPGIQIVAAVCCQELIDLFELIYPGGALRLHWALPWLEMIRSTGLIKPSGPAAEAASQPCWRDLVTTLPLASIEQKLGWEIPTWSEWLNHPTYGREWQRRSIEDDIEKTTTPTMHVAGWFDPCLGQTVASFNRLQSRLHNQALIIGPWDHATLVQGIVASALPPAADGNSSDQFPLFDRMMRWFDHFFGELPSDVAPAGSAVEYFDNGAGQWRRDEQWPPAGVKWRKIYLAPDKRLTWERPECQGHDSYIYDPADPVPTVGGDVFPLGELKPGPLDQGPLAMRSDSLVFTTGRLDRPLSLAGAPRVVLFVSSSAPDTDFTVKLTDTHPDGRSEFVRDGIFRMRYLESRVKPKLINPGAVYRVSIDLGHTTCRFEAGDRLTLVISSSNFPKFDRNLNTQTLPQFEAHPVTARQEIHWGGMQASYLQLPVLDESRPEPDRDRESDQECHEAECVGRALWE